MANGVSDGGAVRPRTIESYESTVRLHLIPGVGRVALTKLTRAQVQTVIKATHRAGNTRTAAYIRTVLRRALTLAVRDGLLHQNVAAMTTAPRQERREVQPLSLAEMKALFNALRGDRDEALFVSAATLGMRKGELLGLRWQDVDMDGGTLTVRYQAQRIGGIKQLVPLKTEKSRRGVALPEFVVNALKQHRKRQLEARLQAGSRWQENDLVFPSTIGTIADSANVTHAYHDALERAELPRQRFHDLRHLAASLMLAQDVNPKVMQEVLGHSQIVDDDGLVRALDAVHRCATWRTGWMRC